MVVVSGLVRRTAIQVEATNPQPGAFQRAILQDIDADEELLDARVAARRIPKGLAARLRLISPGTARMSLTSWFNSAERRLRRLSTRAAQEPDWRRPPLGTVGCHRQADPRQKRPCSTSQTHPPQPASGFASASTPARPLHHRANCALDCGCSTVQSWAETSGESGRRVKSARQTAQPSDPSPKRLPIQLPVSIELSRNAASSRSRAASFKGCP